MCRRCCPYDNPPRRPAENSDSDTSCRPRSGTPFLTSS
ncbi:hypothetical protein M6B38_238895 [Iris pallida]|uniref:Uncharacterized protein n=1 Tax=Iris pallida TaxID=29817 RepID=A0AAX6DM78_IRIPA|nr:hypothetical protein M6B38_238895 [Iris pallida]